MAYVSVESDERLEDGPQGLQFQSFGNTPAAGVSGRNARAGYFEDAPRGGGGSGGGFWTVEYYQQYFDVDTKTVLKRCYTTLLPTSANYLSNHLTPAADLYGPFWTLSTLIFALFLSSSLASSITNYLSNNSEPTAYDFHLLSVAVSLVYAYGLGLPALLWLALRYMGVGEWSVVEAVAVWGYGQFVWIPVAILCVIPVPIVRWILTGIAFAISGYFLGANFYPILATAEHKYLRGLIVFVVLLHAGLALTFKVLFFSYYIKEIGPKDPLGTAPGSGTPTGDTSGNTTTTTAAMLWGL